jgi:hypothetical protein
MSGHDKLAFGPRSSFTRLAGDRGRRADASTGVGLLRRRAFGGLLRMLLFLLAWPLLHPSGFGAGSLAVMEADAPAAGTAMVPVYFQSDTPVAAFETEISFDPAQYTAGAAGQGTLPASFAIDSHQVAPGRMRVAVHSPGNQVLTPGVAFQLPLTSLAGQPVPTTGFLAQAGNPLFSDPLGLPVAAAVAPSVRLTGLSNNGPLNGASGVPLSVQALADGAAGIARVDYFVNGQKVGSSSVGPSYAFKWQPQTYGALNFVAVAFDTRGVQSSSRSFPATVSAVPTVTTGAATTVGLHTAAVHGVVNPNAAATSAHFEYGPTAAYGSTSTSQDAGAGAAARAMAASLSGLQPDTLYHFRAVASNTWGASYGADQTFRTTAVSAVGEIITLSASPAAAGVAAGGGVFAKGTSRTISATANGGYRFVSWTENGVVVSTAADYSFTLLGARTLVANFASDPVTAPGVLQFSQSEYPVLESAGKVEVRVRRTDGSEGVVSAIMALEAGTAEHGKDFIGNNTMVPFASGETEKSVSIPLIDDFALEATESFRLILRLPEGGAVLGPLASATVSILDTDVLDSDGDGIDDDWERRIFGNLTIARAGTDFDKDRFTDLEEFRRKLNPKTVSSRLNQPDGAVGMTVGKTLGQNLYDSLATRQTLSLILSKGTSKTVFFTLQNDSPKRNTILVRGGSGTSSVRVRYFMGATEVTKQIVSGTFRVANLLPAASRTVKVVVSSPKNVSAGTRHVVTLDLHSNVNRAARDRVALSVVIK